MSCELFYSFIKLILLIFDLRHLIEFQQTYNYEAEIKEMINLSKIKDIRLPKSQFQLSHKPFLTKKILLSIPKIDEIKQSRDRIHWSVPKKLCNSNQFRYSRIKQASSNQKISLKVPESMSFTHIGINKLQTFTHPISINDDCLNLQLYQSQCSQIDRSHRKRFKTLTSQNRQKNEKNIDLTRLKYVNFNISIQSLRMKIRKVKNRKNNCKTDQLLKLRGIGYKLEKDQLKQVILLQQYRPNEAYTTIS